ncbi:hypothetical protein GJ744_011440 [Endocarpon pusillum]|uniref:Inclusion body clearance protein IML2 n=1 Tax=Endocarpon pusillum TaxID=364733 RepID=A0A8H7AGK1_9EURO|nr:hypothetical protein GJ744_011440 [Endocarpon pusillum]
MHRVGAWFQPRKLHHSASTQSLDALVEAQNLEAAMRAVTLIMNDDVEGAERGLAQGNSSYHKLGMGVIVFLRATLGFEQDVIKEASERLAEAESSATLDLYKAQRSERYNAGGLYAPGSEFALCNALAQITSAVVAVLNESLTDAIRAFYKLRKAYITLNGLVEEEDRVMKARGFGSHSTSKHPSSESLKSSGVPPTVSKALPGSFDINSRSTRSRAHPLSRSRTSDNMSQGKPQNQNTDDDDDDEFYDADDVHKENPTKTYTGHLDIGLPKVSSKLNNMSLSEGEGGHDTDSNHSEDLPPATKVSRIDLRRFSHDPDSHIFTNSVDVFVHSGVNLCFGLLLLFISAIPPAFSKLLYIIGFRGDRERGIKMLWQASKFHNINGALAGLALLGWYNGLVGFCDIVPDANPDDPEDVEGYPAARLEALLADMRSRYPNSLMWRIEEARMASAHRDLDSAIRLLSHTGKSSLRQVEALNMFEKSLTALNCHRYQLCSDSFIACVELNSWSRALYYYIAGSAHLAMYRDFRSSGKRDEAAKQAILAEKYFKLAPTHTGKRKIMARQLPFDVFVARKVTKWTARAEAWNCDFVDAVGVSPSEEMVFFWNGYKRMSAAQLEHSLRNLAWSDDPEQNMNWKREELDEHAILAVLRASIYRHLRKHDEAKALLQKEVLCHDKMLFKGQNRDDWTAPTAHYEMGVNLWMQRSQYLREYGAGMTDPSTDRATLAQHSSTDLAPGQARNAKELLDIDIQKDARLVSECREYIEKASKWERYDLDARVGLKITTAGDALRKWEAQYGPLKK